MKLSINKKTKKRLLVIYMITFILGLFISVFIFNQLAKKKDYHQEVTFIDPHQALIFWKTEELSLGYIKYGPKKNKRQETIYQTSSVPGQVHAVLIENIPPEGIFVSLHQEGESPFLFPQVEKIKFELGNNE